MNAAVGRYAAVIGLGSMGMGMARALRRGGFDVVGCDANPATVEHFVREGGRGAPDPASAAANVDIVICVVVNAAQTEAVLFGENGVASSMPEGAVFISSATMDPAACRRLDTAFQYQLLKEPTHEIAILLGLVVEWGGTGAVHSGIATPYTTLTPTFYFGKGFGDLPEAAGWVRAFAVTGQLGYQIPTQSFDLVQGTFIPQVLTWSGSMQYSMPYLKSEIQDLQLPDFINHLIPIVEFQMSTPVANNFGNSFLTTGTINPGVIWVGSYFQVGLEAQLPVNGASGHGVGVLGPLHLYLDDIFPTTIGQPLLGGTSTAPRQLTF